jgi:TetR/AcrR family transcriptional repressor of nem operon
MMIGTREGERDVARKSKVEAAQTRKRIVETAAKAFKSNGIDGTGVAEIMSAAGLTHGGFYRHFESKEQLIAEACASSMEVLNDAAEAAAEKGNAAFLKHLESFISTDGHAEYLGGCPLVAMGSELARADIQIRRVVSEGFEKLFDIMVKNSGIKDGKLAKEDAMFTLSCMVGAVTLARIMDDSKISGQILAVTKKRLGETSAPMSKRPAKAKAA